ncbi:MAG: TonB-dependent receptor plug domain-containing protein, partial [Chromatocurvus sp.]
MALGGANAQSAELEEVTIVGSIADARILPGSGSVIDNEQITIEFATDINQLLKTVPGVYIREEDGYGLRPNIGIRGATSERASKVTLMEDGVMIAPAPYSNPAAYYFPTTLRMHTTEVVKGAPLLRYGPQTTGGVINMVSTPIPDEFGGRVNLRYGQN